MLFVETIDVPTPAATVFDFVSDFNNLPKWDPTIVRVEQTVPGPVQRGTTYIVVLSFLGIETTMHYLVDEYAAPTRAVLRGTAATVLATDTVTVEPRATGSRAIWKAEIELAWPVRLLDPIVRLFFAPTVAQAIVNLKAALIDLDSAAANVARV
jgi:carbon monoxide dehydrogenase subunit G